MPSVKIPNGSGGWIKIPTVKGDAGTITSVTLTSGNHAAGTTDTYTITYNDGSTTTFTVYNGADGSGAGDMVRSVYDPAGKNANAFNVDNHVSGTTNKVYTATEQTKLDGIATGANNYTHPTGDGNLHVPATSTTNSGKVLTAGATAGSLSWVAPTVGAQIATGSYTGTGTYGSGNQNSISFGFVPKLLYVSARSGEVINSSLFGGGSYYGFLLDYTAAVNNAGSPKTFYALSLSDATIYYSSLTYALSNGNMTISWYGADQSKQLNSNGATFSYIAIG